MIANIISTYGDAVQGRHSMPVPSTVASFRSVCSQLKKAAIRTKAQADRDCAALNRQYMAAPDEAAISAACSVASNASRHVAFWDRMSEPVEGPRALRELFRFITSEYGL